MTVPARRIRPNVPMERARGWVRSPLMEFDDLVSRMEGLLESSVGAAATTGPAAWAPLADVTETDDAFKVEVELPGVKPEDVDVEVNGQELLVTGEIKEKEREGTVRSNTRRTGQFEYRMLLTGEVDTENVEATMSDGVLSITAHKAEAMKPRHIEVKASNDGNG
jgi:HSP20 family protein